MSHQPDLPAIRTRSLDTAGDGVSTIARILRPAFLAILHTTAAARERGHSAGSRGSDDARSGPRPGRRKGARRSVPTARHPEGTALTAFAASIDGDPRLRSTATDSVRRRFPRSWLPLTFHAFYSQSKPLL